MLKIAITNRKCCRNQTVKNIGKESNHLKIYRIIRKHIPDSFFAMPIAEQSAQSSGPREVILSEYLCRDVESNK